MQDSLNLQIRAGIRDYLANTVSLPQFLDWLLDREEEVQKAGDLELEDLIQTIKLYWAELTGDHLTKEEFRDLLRPFVELLVVPLEAGEPTQRRSFRTFSESEIKIEKLRVWEYQPIFSPSSLVYNSPSADDSQGNLSKRLIFQ